MKRVFVFLVIGPLIGVFCSYMFDVAMTGSFPLSDVAEGAAMTILFSLVVSFGALLMDAWLALGVPVRFRVPLTAAVGASIAIGLIGHFHFHQWIPIGMLAAFAMGTCSVLSHS
jgi:hypothetical protein